MITLITGGQRSGKSEAAERLALSLSSHPVYIATARVYDDEFRRRVAMHQLRRGHQWINIEEDKELGRHNVDGCVVLVDCLTLWAANFFFDLGHDVDRALGEMKAELGRLTAARDARFIFVTSEIGLGGTSDNELQRRFADLQGLLNQHVAAMADEVYMMVSGIKVKVK